MTHDDSIDTPDLSYLGPATLLAVHVAVDACDKEIRLLTEKGSFRRLSAEEKTDLHGWRQTRHQILTQPYPPPYQTRQASGVVADPVV